MNFYTMTVDTDNREEVELFNLLLTTPQPDPLGGKEWSFTPPVTPAMQAAYDASIALWEKENKTPWMGAR